MLGNDSPQVMILLMCKRYEGVINLTHFHDSPRAYSFSYKLEF